MNFPGKTQNTAKEARALHKRKIGSCMIYRSDIVWIESAGSQADIFAVFKANADVNYFPVCAGKIDAVIGILSARAYLQSRFETPPPHLRTILEKPLFIPESQTVERTLQLLTEQSVNAACIIDEYGGIEGFVTKNGLLTLLLHEMLHSAGSIEPQVIRQADGGVVVNAQMSLDEVQGLHLLDDLERSHDEEYYTLAGYLLARIGAIPKPGDTIDIGTSVCTILGMSGQRIDKVLIKKKSVSHVR